MELYSLFCFCFLAGELPYLPRLWKLPSANVSTRPFYQFLQQSVMLIHLPPVGFLFLLYCYEFLDFISFFHGKMSYISSYGTPFLTGSCVRFILSNLTKYKVDREKNCICKASTIRGWEDVMIVSMAMLIFSN